MNFALEEFFNFSIEGLLVGMTRLPFSSRVYYLITAFFIDGL